MSVSAMHTVQVEVVKERHGARRGIVDPHDRPDALADFETVMEFYRGIALQDDSGNDVLNPFAAVRESRRSTFANGELGGHTVCGYDFDAVRKAAEGPDDAGVCQQDLTARLLRAVGHMAARDDAHEIPTLVFTRPSKGEVMDALKNIHEGAEDRVDAFARRLESLDASRAIDSDLLWSSVWNYYTTESPACQYAMAQFSVEDGGGSVDRWTGYLC
eukprot:jgi/Tetstr1/461325/TSEL_006452.t1